MNKIKINTIVDSYTKGITPKYTEKSKILVLNQKCIRNNRINFSLAQYHCDSKAFSPKKIIEVGDILINSTGKGTAGRVAFVTQLPDNITVIPDSHILVLKINDFYTAGCLAYILYNNEDYLQELVDGSTGQGEFDKQRLFNMEVSLPEKNTRESAFNILHTLDKKIDLNTEINTKIKNLATDLYLYWFLQFDFPDSNNSPYKSSGGEMVYSSELGREIPTNWEAKSLNEIAKTKTTSVIPSDFPEKTFKYFSIPIFDKTGNYSLEKGKHIGSNKFALEKGNLIVSKLNPKFNRVVYILDNDEQICSTEFVVWESPEQIQSFLYMIAVSERFITYCMQSATGTSNSHKRVNPSFMMKFKIPYNQKIIERYSEKIQPLLSIVFLNNIENQKLSEIRDSLLPKLMSS